MDKIELLKRMNSVKLTKKEKRIGEFFLDEDKSVFLMTVSELAKKIGVSDTSIIRFIKTIGFNNFTEFKNSGQQQIKTHLDKTNEFIKNIDLIKENSIEKLYIDKINEEINRIFEKNSLKKIDEIAKLIMKKQNKFIVGFKSTAGISNFFGVRLGFLIKDVFSFNVDDSVVLNAIYNIKYNDVLIIFDYPMYSKTSEVLAKIAKQKKAKLIVFSDSENAPLAKYADILYKVKLDGISLFNSLISSQILIEYLLTHISKFNNDKENKQRFSEIRKFLIEKLK